ncbi:unnamed protein product [Withania somnifera]
MKLKAFLTDNGCQPPGQEVPTGPYKNGKDLSPLSYKIYFLYNLLNADGIQCIAQYRKEALFDEYRISSQNDDRISFALSFATYPSEHHQYSHRTRGYKSAVIQDVPISKPLSRSDVLELQAALDMAQELPQTLIQVPDMQQLHNFVDKMRNVGDVLNVSISKCGDLHLQVSTSLITLGAEFRKLTVAGQQAESPTYDQNLSAQSRTRISLQRGDAMTVQVSVKHFFKSLYCHSAKPDRAFYGIARHGACLTVVFQFYIPGTDQTDKAISLHCRLPVLDPGAS